MKKINHEGHKGQHKGREVLKLTIWRWQLTMKVIAENIDDESFVTFVLTFVVKKTNLREVKQGLNPYPGGF
jgi:hypothetical protein